MGYILVNFLLCIGLLATSGVLLYMGSPMITLPLILLFITSKDLKNQVVQVLKN